MFSTNLVEEINHIICPSNTAFSEWRSVVWQLDTCCFRQARNRFFIVNIFYVSLKGFDRVRSDFDVVASQKREKAAESTLVPCLVIFVTVRKLDLPYLSNYATRLKSEGLWFDSWQRKEVFSSKRPDRICSSSSLLVSACRGSCTRCVKLTTAHHIAPRLKMSRAIIPLSRIHSWPARRQVFTLSKYEKPVIILSRK